MIQNGLVSIIMPAKNAAPYLKACLQSIIEQTYQNWELLICDDHSSDITLSILEQSAKQDNRIKVFQNLGYGIIPSLQTAYKNAQGVFVTRMDADDIMSKDKIELLVEACIEEKSLATGLVEYFSDGNLGEGYRKYASWLNQNLQTNNPFDAIYKECVIPSPCWMMRKESFDVLGAFSEVRYPEDYDLCFRMRKAQLSVNTVNQVLHHWRDYPERSSRTDANYADNRFLDLKVHYFLQDDFDERKPLVIWGAGQKGKSVARKLIERKTPFFWITNNEKKIGHNIYGVELLGEEKLKQQEEAQILVCVAGPLDQEYIRNVLNKNKKGVAFWFC